jgi:type VI protein secretion system component VasF
VVRSRLTRVVSGLGVSLAAILVFAPSAIAADGVGLWGRTDDRVVTYWGFALIAFFAIMVIVLSLIQIRLENRRERLREELERLRRP